MRIWVNWQGKLMFSPFKTHLKHSFLATRFERLEVACLGDTALHMCKGQAQGGFFPVHSCTSSLLCKEHSGLFASAVLFMSNSPFQCSDNALCWQRKNHVLSPSHHAGHRNTTFLTAGLTIILSNAEQASLKLYSFSLPLKKIHLASDL